MGTSRRAPGEYRTWPAPTHCEQDKGSCEESLPVLRTLADKVNWLIDRAHPAGRGPFSNNEIAALIRDATGEDISYTTIWKLRNGQAQNPQKRLIEALAKTFSVPPAFSFDAYDGQAGMLKEQVELLALVRGARISSTQLRGSSSSARKRGK